MIYSGHKQISLINKNMKKFFSRLFGTGSKTNTSALAVTDDSTSTDPNFPKYKAISLYACHSKTKEGIPIHSDESYLSLSSKKYPLIDALRKDNIPEIIKILKEKGVENFYFLVDHDYGENGMEVKAHSPLDFAKSDHAKRLLLAHNARAGAEMWKEDKMAYNAYISPIKEREKAEAAAKKEAEEAEKTKMVDNYLATLNK